MHLVGSFSYADKKDAGFVTQGFLKEEFHDNGAVKNQFHEIFSESYRVRSSRIRRRVAMLPGLVETEGIIPSMIPRTLSLEGG